METTEGKYAHLLQPIRELAKNWDINVASELNDYLEELDEMSITFDGGITRLNFAEAALVIQGTTCIYSKKVELLHHLVYQTLEHIKDKNKKHSKQAAGSQEDEAASSAEDDNDFALTAVDLETSENSLTGDYGTTVKVTPLPPVSLFPAESKEIKSPLISVKGEAVRSVKDFRINVFTAEEDMILFLTSGAGASQLVLDPPPPLPGDHPVEDGDQDFLPMDQHSMEVEPMEEHEEHEEHVERQQAAGEGRVLRERRVQVDQDGGRVEEKKATVNHWVLHDPYTVVAKEKPLKPGNCSRIPAGLDDGAKKKKRGRSAPLEDFGCWSRGTFGTRERKLRKGPAHTDLIYIYMKNIKSKVKRKKRICRETGVAASAEELRQTYLHPEEEEPVDGFIQHDLFGGDDDASDGEQQGALLDGGPAGGAEQDFPLTGTCELSYEELVKRRVEQLVISSTSHTQQTALSQRVQRWQETLRSELARQEDRPPFDIHDYGERVVAALSGVGQRRSFSTIVSGLDNYEVCKFLLASLQLANDYTVEVDSDGTVDSMMLTLCTTARATDRFKTLESRGATA